MQPAPSRRRRIVRDLRREHALVYERLSDPILVRRVTFLTKKNAPILTGTSIYRADRVSYRLTVSA